MVISALAVIELFSCLYVSRDAQGANIGAGLLVIAILAATGGWVAMLAVERSRSRDSVRQLTAVFAAFASLSALGLMVLVAVGMWEEL